MVCFFNFNVFVSVKITQDLFERCVQIFFKGNCTKNTNKTFMLFDAGELINTLCETIAFTE